MSRSTLTFWLVAELVLIAPAALAAPKGDKLARCLATCDQMKDRFEKSCKQTAQGGKCEGRGRALVSDMDKQCRDSCAKRKK